MIYFIYSFKSCFELKIAFRPQEKARTCAKRSQTVGGCLRRSVRTYVRPRPANGGPERSCSRFGVEVKFNASLVSTQVTQQQRFTPKVICN